MEKVNITNWRLAYMNHSEYAKSDFYPVTKRDIEDSRVPVLNATVPGNFEIDFIKAGLLPENLYFGVNVLETQKYESTHLWYFADFEIKETDKDAFILFEGIDTAAEIFIDGEFFAFSENMLIPYEYSLDGFDIGKHEVMVHIIPASVYTRDIPLDPKCRGLKYNLDSLLIRKAPYMYGWDIMPRIVSGGLWKPVSVVYKNKSRIKDYRLSTTKIFENEAEITLDISFTTQEDDLRDFAILVEGKCKDSTFTSCEQAFGVNKKLHINIANPKLWWPKNYGEPELYDVTISLLYKGETCDSVNLKLGIRTVLLERTSQAGENGTFRFIVNGKPIMCLGTNWVPTDAFPSRHKEYTMRGLEMVNDLNCNMIRCWGGNVYPEEAFYDFCDKNGILVWQDFSMACAIYPNDERFLSLIKEEAEYIVKRLRNRTCLALWSGDNECDGMYVWDRISFKEDNFHQSNPNNNKITREVLPSVISRLDNVHSFLPSSPYLDEIAFINGNPSEDHLWGPRDYFKGDYYNLDSKCHFASETGYHGCPSPQSLRKFMNEENLKNVGDSKICTDPQWLVHASGMNTDVNGIYAYRIPLMTAQIERLFDGEIGDISEYALKSQISQGEAVKFFIEHFRIQKNYRWGILWWNIIDGWPQISDAIVDWYGTKKLAYSYIKRSQQPFALMCDEPDKNGEITLCAINDTRNPATVNYVVTEAKTNKTMLKGTVSVNPDEKIEIGAFKEQNGEYYIIKWNGEQTGINHFTGAIGDKIKLNDYIAFMKKADFYKDLEGF